MKYLVTGGSGFLGREVVEKILSSGHEVRVLDNNFRGSFDLLSEHTSLELAEGDIRDTKTVDKVTQGVDSIVHMAFINGTKYFYEKPELVVDVGIRGMLNVSEAAKNNNVKEIILISSSEVYQSPAIIPTPENIPLVIPDILNPRYSYGGAKIASELILVNYCASYLNSWKIIRPHNIYGPEMGQEHVIPELIGKIRSSEKQVVLQGDGSQTRAFCYISDFGEAFMLALEDKNTNQIYNIGVEHEVSINQLTELLLEISGKKLILQHSPGNLGETLRRCPDIKKIRDLGFVPKVSLKQGLTSLMKNN